MLLLASLPLLSALPLLASSSFLDRSHPSKTFSEPRHYRIFLPPNYSSSTQRYPVIYYFHGHSDRYTLEHYDQGRDTVPKIAAFVASHPVIVVAPDGYIARDYTGFYGGAPYDIAPSGQSDYGAYFLELTAHIDSTYRTLTARRHRATSGLSMGGFLSLYLSARFPESIGSASAFNPGPEFFSGEPGRRSLWRPKDHTANHAQSMIRLVRASGDYISQYHEELRAAYAASPVDFEFRQDEYHRHWATSIAETFDFHTRAFSNPALDTLPESWSYSSTHASFDIRGYHVAANLPTPATISLQNVSQGGLRLLTRQWSPDGPPAACSTLTLTTAPLYSPGAPYRIYDHDWTTNKTTESALTANPEGRLTLALSCRPRELSFSGPGTGAQPPVLLPLTKGDLPRLLPGRNTPLPLRIYNPRTTSQTVRAELTSQYPTVELPPLPTAEVTIEPGREVDLGGRFPVRFTAGNGYFARTRLHLKLTYDGYHEATAPIDLLIAPDALPAPDAIEILDGRTATFPVFRQKGNQGGGQPIDRTVTEGSGNGNGILEPGEQATIWVKLRQGLDPFDKHTWHRAKVYADSPYLEETADIQEEKQREWTGARNRTSLVQLARHVPPGTELPVLLDCESWSFHFTPDVRYGPEPLYQAFQLHQHHLLAWKWKSNSQSTHTERD